MFEAKQSTARHAPAGSAPGRPLYPNEGFHRWWAARRRSVAMDVDLIPFSELTAWTRQPDSGNLVHDSGRFFTVEGLRVAAADGVTWSQPVVNQPEIGILGILVKDFDGVRHCLMQAKVEPGNINGLQLSPTVQATFSNYTRVHGGGASEYLEYFTGGAESRVLVDVLQSEQGRWFWRKRNRNMVVQALGDVPEHEDFRWLPLHQVWRLMHSEDLVNMSARTVLSCMPPPAQAEPGRPHGDRFRDALARSYTPGDARHRLQDITAWLTEQRALGQWDARLVPLAQVPGWPRTDREIRSPDAGHFRIIAARIRATNREVREWTQPLLAPHTTARAAFAAKQIDGVLHLLVRARREPGLTDAVELAPTVHHPYTTHNAWAPATAPAPGTTTVNGAASPPDPITQLLTQTPLRTRFDTVLSEEGGRLYHARTRYQIVEVDRDFPLDVPEEFRWMTVSQLVDLVQHSYYLTVEARSLLACLHGLR